MFARVKKSRGSEYLQIVENYRDGDRVRQRMVLYVGHYSSIGDALKRMPRDVGRMRRLRRRGAVREADELAAKLEALRALVKERPDLLSRDGERAERHRRRNVSPVHEAIKARVSAGYVFCGEPGCDRWAFVGEKGFAGMVHYLCREHYEEARPAMEKAAEKAAERRARISKWYG